MALNETEHVAVFVPKLGFGLFKVTDVITLQGRTIGVYHLTLGKDLHRQWCISLSQPGQLLTTTVLWGTNGDARWCSFRQTAAGLQAAADSEWLSSELRDTFMHQAAHIVAWIQPIQERLDDLFDSLNICSEDLSKFPLTPFIEGAENGQPDVARN